MSYRPTHACALLWIVNGQWAVENQPRLNIKKTVKIIVSAEVTIDPQPSNLHSLNDVERVSTIKVFGVSFSHQLSMSGHITDPPSSYAI